jgi:hypothetical protein
MLRPLQTIKVILRQVEMLDLLEDHQSIAPYKKDSSLVKINQLGLLHDLDIFF